MKLKPNINKDAIKAFLSRNVEKLLMGVASLFVVLAIFFSVRQDTLPPEKQSDRLVDKVNQAAKSVENAGHSTLPTHEYISDARAGFEVAAAASYNYPTLWSPPLHDEKIKRAEPDFFAAEKPRLATGYGLFALKAGKGGKQEVPVVAVKKPPTPPREGRDGSRDSRDGRDRDGARDRDNSDAMQQDNDQQTAGQPVTIRGTMAQGDGSIKGFRWICITALVPTAKQEEEFQARFKTAMKVADFDSTRDKPKYVWYKIEREQRSPDGNVSRVLPEEFHTIAMKWRTFAQEAWETVPQEIVSQDFVVSPLTGQLGPLMFRDWDSRVVSHPDLTAAPKPSEAVVEREPTDDAQIPTIGAGPPAAAKRAPDRATPGSDVKVAPHKLFRYFDYDVEPGHSYRYRVVLMLANPNYIPENDPKFRQKVTAMESVKVAQGTYRDTPATEWTDWTSVPPDHKVYALKVKALKTMVDPVATVMCIGWDIKTCLETGREFEMIRGDIANWPGVKDMKDAKEHRLLFIDALEQSLKPLPSFDFKADMMLVDVRGGGVNNNNGPLEMLFSDMHGNLIIHTETGDAQDVKEFQALMTPASGTLDAEPERERGERDRGGRTGPRSPAAGY